MSAAGPVRVRIVRLPGFEDVALPEAHTGGASGLDLHAALNGGEVIEPGQRATIPTGIAVALPPGTEAQVRPRSGLSAKHGVTVLNAPGTIDSDYRGEIKVLLVNLGAEPFEVSRGMRIAQLVVTPVLAVELEEVVALPTSARGENGLGSTGVSAATADGGT